MAAWWTIGKYTMRLNLGKAYRKRKVVFPAVAVTYLLYAIGFKVLVDANPKNLVVMLLSDKALFATLLDLLMLYLFVYLVMIHVFTGIRRQNKSSIELLLSAPVRSEDIILGETIAMLPIYILIAPIIIIPTLILGYFQAGIGALGLLKILLSQLLLLILAIGVGAILLTLIQSSIQRTKSSKYFRLLASALSAGLYLSIYFLRSWISTAESVTQNRFFDLLPTSLTGNIAFSEITGYVPSPSIIVSFLILCAWILVFYGVGIRMAGKAYSLEKELAGAKISVEKEGLPLRVVRLIAPKGYAEKVVTHFKLYFRDSNNSATSIYLLIIAYMIPTFFAWTSRPEATDSLEIFYLVGLFMVPIFVSISMISMLYLSRDALWIWKKAPGGTDMFVNSKWIQSFILSLIYLPIPIITGVILNIGALKMASSVLLLLLINAFSISFSIFLNVLSPTKSIQGAKVGINAMVSSMGIFFLIIALAVPLLSRGLNIYQFTILVGGLLNVLGYFLVRLSKIRIVGAMDI